MREPIINRNVMKNISKLNPTMYKIKLYTTTKWDLSQECKADSTFKNHLM